MVATCWNGPACPYLRRRCCLFRHSVEEVASASLVGRQNPQHDCLQRESLLTLSEDVAALQLSFQRLAAAVMWRTGTPVREEDAGRRDQATQTLTTGPLDSDGVEDRGSPAVAVHRRSCAVACDLADLPGDQACRDSADSALRKSGRGALVDAATGLSAVAQPADQARRDFAHGVHQQVCRCAYCDTATGFTVAQPGDQAHRDSADTVLRSGSGPAYCDTATGPADSNCAEDGGSLARADYACGDAATSPSVPDGGEDSGSLASAVHACSDATTGPSVSGDDEDDQARRIFVSARQGDRAALTKVLLSTAITFIDEQIANSPVPMTQARLVEVVGYILSSRRFALRRTWWTFRVR